MAFRSLYFALLICSLLALPVSAQTTPIVGGIQTVTTTGMIGLVNGQTARLSVLNLNPTVPASDGAAAPVNCNVELKFFDAGGTAVGPNKVVTNFAPQSAAILDADRLMLNPPGVAATLRGQIRGVVTVNPPLPTAIPGPGNCSVMVTLEIIDNTTGSTIALTTATHTTGPAVPISSIFDRR
jgi:hypothetical protein